MSEETIDEAEWEAQMVLARENQARARRLWALREAIGDDAYARVIAAMEEHGVEAMVFGTWRGHRGLMPSTTFAPLATVHPIRGKAGAK